MGFLQWGLTKKAVAQNGRLLGAAKRVLWCFACTLTFRHLCCCWRGHEGRREMAVAGGGFAVQLQCFMLFPAHHRTQSSQAALWIFKPGQDCRLRSWGLAATMQFQPCALAYAHQEPWADSVLFTLCIFVDNTEEGWHQCHWAYLSTERNGRGFCTILTGIMWYKFKIVYHTHGEHVSWIFIQLFKPCQRAHGLYVVT